MAAAANTQDSNVAVVTVNYRTPELTMRCIAALANERKCLPKLQALVVDGGSGDGSADQLASSLADGRYASWVRFLPLPINGGFGWANNQAILTLARQSPRPEFVHLLNPDAEITPGAIFTLAKYLRSYPRAAAVGSQLLNADGTLAGSAFSFPSVRGEFSRGARTGLLARLLKVPAISIETSEAMEIDWVTGASVMFRLDALREVGLFDDGFFLYNEEVELMWRLRQAGWAVATEPASRVRHVGGAATGVSDRKAESRWPRYMFRSRTRFFGLTRGRLTTYAAYLAWLAGHAVWTTRRILRIGRGKAVGHQARDHLRNAFPVKHDFIPAAASLDGELGKSPAWMVNTWL